VVFPQALLPLAVNRPVSMESVNRALAGDRLLFLVLQEDDSDEPTAENLKRIGTVGVIRQMAKAPSGGINIIVEGLARVRADLYTRSGTSLRAQITPLPEKVEKTIEVEAHVRRIQELIEKAVSITTGLSEELRDVVMHMEDPLRLALRPGDTDRHEAGGQAGAARRERCPEEARGGRGGAHTRGLAAGAQRQD
jgi:ATP-dependent Lon protease